MRGEKTKPKSGGFTLLEVMVAVAVLAVGVVPLLVTHSSTVANIRRSRELTIAVLLARSRLAELEAAGFTALAVEPVLGGPERGAGEGPHPFLELEAEVAETEPLALLEAKVAVSRRFRPAGEGDDPAGVAFNSYIANLYFEEEELAEEE